MADAATSIEGGNHPMTAPVPVLEYAKPSPRTSTPLAWISFVLSGFVLLSFFSVSVATFADRPLPEAFAYSAIASQYVSPAALPCAITGLFFRDSRLVASVAVALLVIAWVLLYVAIYVR